MLVYYFVPFIVSNRYLLFWVSNGHNSITVQNRTHVYMNFFDHKDLGIHLLQLCPKVVKHPVYYKTINGPYNIKLHNLFFINHKFLILSWRERQNSYTYMYIWILIFIDESRENKWLCLYQFCHDDFILLFLFPHFLLQTYYDFAAACNRTLKRKNFIVQNFATPFFCNRT